MKEVYSIPYTHIISITYPLPSACFPCQPRSTHHTHGKGLDNNYTFKVSRFVWGYHEEFLVQSVCFAI